MAHPYRDFWITAGMIAVGVFAANTAAKKGTPYSPPPPFFPTVKTASQPSMPTAAPTPSVTNAANSAAPASPLAPQQPVAPEIQTTGQPVAVPADTALQPITITSSPSPPPSADDFESLVAATEVPEVQPVPVFAPTEPATKFAYLKATIPLREGPGPSYVVTLAGGQNLQVAIIGQENGWMRVSGGPNAIGWVPKDMVGSTPTLSIKPKPQTTRSFDPPVRDGGR